jgi:hypothetical protein
MRLRLRRCKQKLIADSARGGAISLEIGRGFVVSSAAMKLRQGLAALAVLALSLPGLRASAQTESGEEQPSEEKAAGPAPAAPETPAEPAAKLKAAPEPEPPRATGPFTPFAPPPAPLRFGNDLVNVQFGVLVQPAFQAAGDAAADGLSKNLFVRRTRLILGGTIYKYFEYFIDTDWPDLFKQDAVDTTAASFKNAPGMNIQDAFLTGKAWGDCLNVDFGFMLPPLSHNNIESAAKLYGPDYFANSFRRNASFLTATDPFRSTIQNPQGRDAGLQLRGLLAFGHVEYRVGLFQGLRVTEMPGPPGQPATVGSKNFFRFSARLQVNLLDAEPGFFHAGTYHGAKKIVSVGGFYDRQDSYKYFGGDLFIDLPLGPGVFTFQADVVQWDGGTLLVGVLKNTAYMGEVGYLIGPLMLSPIFRYERLVTPLVHTDPSDPTTPLIADSANPSENRIGGGLAFWPFGHNTNFKAFYSRVHRLPGFQNYNQIDVQWQLYFY